MKKNKKKENFDNVVINKTELTPTTIGKIESDEGSIWSVVILFVSLIAIIIALPYVVNLIKNFGEHEEEPVIIDNNNNNNNNEENPEVNPNEEEKDDNYIAITDEVSKTIKGYRYDIVIDNKAKTLNVKVTNMSGTMTLLIDTPMYIELYNTDKTLEDRILINKEEVVNDATKEFDFKFKNRSDDDIAYLTLDTKSINDYPAISVDNIDDNNNPFFTCIKDNETLVYTFKEDETGYYLTTINDRFLITENDEETINTYETYAASYNSVEGVEADITPKSNGFTFETIIYLDNVSIKEKQRILNNPAFYEKDTLAKTIYFELNASGYKCN